MAIDREKVIQDMSKVSVVGDEDGLIPAFGVFVNQLPADFWNSFAEKITKSVPEDLIEIAAGLLMNAAHECGYHTGWGIINSEEWKAIVAPMVEEVPEDILHGAFAVFTAWGWAKSEVVELVPGEKMVIHAYDYYEADVAEDGKSPHHTAHMIRGVAAAFMDLAYGEAYPNGMRTFKCEQTKGIETGDDLGEFVITRA